MVFALDKNKKGLEALKSEFPNVTLITVDLRDWDETQRLVRAISPIDHLVNNAAISGTSFFEEVAAEQIDEYEKMKFSAFVSVEVESNKSNSVHKIFLDSSM